MTGERPPQSSISGRPSLLFGIEDAFWVKACARACMAYARLLRGDLADADEAVAALAAMEEAPTPWAHRVGTRQV